MECTRTKQFWSSWDARSWRKGEGREVTTEERGSHPGQELDLAPSHEPRKFKKNSWRKRNIEMLRDTHQTMK
ncbi:hypothetical protein N665_0104s0340 [Sinapis alba]|nr:hypothetical protein N665_0104s0340 [Sinapis alba]